MLMAIMAACGLWGVSWAMGKRLQGAWGIILPGALMPVVASVNLSFSQWRWLLVAALLSTAVMLFHHRLRRYLLLPSCIALAGAIAAISVNSGGL
ncbi:DUF1435 family protein [Mixta tenebrionis]|uniref:DUF1435 domain-containing protein n=1 Tax=Mixta tenebrionis TaxID=2562439 RepID=A0A506VEF4_9GAMM|nr:MULTISPECIES: DUF1435 family protein [Mixta]QHM76828.1 hypothetical protein C7M52_02814 [Mixta theicola]TPW43759.1 DUF1435 domain-containing protein [Mixta tenebrionis]